MDDKKITFTPDQLMANSVSIVNLFADDLYRKLHRIGQYEGPEYKKFPYDELIKRAEILQIEINELVDRCVRAKEQHEDKEE